MFEQIPDVDIEIPTPDTSGITDMSQWPREVWAVIAGLIVVGIAWFVWNNMSDKVKMVLVVALMAIAAVYFAS